MFFFCSYFLFFYRGITKDAFCEFFLGQKVKNLARCLEVSTRLQSQLNSALNEAVQSYNHYSSVERFKARMYLQQLSRLLGTMEENLSKTQDSFLKTKVHETTTLNEYDETINQLQSKMLKLRDSLNKLYAPRKIDVESQSLKNDKQEIIPEHFVKDFNTVRNIILVVRKIKCSSPSKVSELKNILDAYTIQCSIRNGCSQ